MAKIVILEDDLVFADQLRSDLSDRGHHTTVFSAPESALKHIKNNPTDLVIVDLFIRAQGELQRDGGITMIAKIKQGLSWHLPVIAISGAFSGPINAVNAHTTALTVGADITLGKPFLPQELHDAIERLLTKYQSS